MKLMSPKQGQDFIWLAEYIDGSYLTEFDLVTGKDNSFYNINKEKLVRFGLIGHNIKMCFDTLGGNLNLAGTYVELVLRDKDGKEYPITGTNETYRDIITYKDAEASFDLLGSTGATGRITKYNMGFKKTLTYDDLIINSKVIFTVPFKQLSYFTFRFVCNKDFIGDLLIKYNGKLVETIDCDFKKDKGYELNWIMK